MKSYARLAGLDPAEFGGHSLRAGFVNPFDRGDVALTGRFTAPDGRRIDVPGFLFARATDATDTAAPAAAGEPARVRPARGRPRRAAPPPGDRWQVRFSAPEPGPWSVAFSLRSKRGLVVSPAHDFEIAAGMGAHYVRIGTAIFGPRSET